MHLLVVGVKWPPETFIERKLNALVQKGIRITVATHGSTGQKGFHMPGIQVVHLPHWDDLMLVNLARFTWNLMALSLAGKSSCAFRLLRVQSWQSAKVAFAKARSQLALARIEPDVVHFEWNSAAIDCMPLYDIWNCPITISCRGSQVNIAPHNPARRSMRKELQSTFQRAAAVHCVSEDIKREAVQYGLDPAKAWVIRPAVNPSFFCPTNRQKTDGPLRMITTGSLISSKGLEYALLAVRQLVDRGIQIRFDILGEGPERQRVVYTIQDLDLGGQVHLLGRMSPFEVRDSLQQADIFVLPSLSEGISNAVLEGMACGLPVVTTDCGGMLEAVEHGVEGLVVPVREPREMANALYRLTTDTELRDRMGRAGRERVLREFTLDRQAESFVDMFESVLP